MRHPLRALLPTVLLLSPGVAWGQQPTPGGVVLRAQAPVQTVKHHASFMVSGGFDLDVLGNIVGSALGARDGAQLAVRSPRPWPDVYVSIPKRAQLAVGFGVFGKDEVVARLSRTTYKSDPLSDVGNFAGEEGNETLVLDLSPYRERAWEVGWRHYMMLSRRAKQYANFMYGLRTVEPIDGTFSTSGPAGPLGTLRLYDRAQLKTFSLEVGFSFETGHAGLFAEFGGRWQQKLKAIDDDLATWALEPVNDTGLRFYMPLQFGVLFRL